MKELSLKELQKMGLDILINVDSFCESNHIKYSIAYGTLIGAIRHKGFIPWDDDVDIIMPRPDYERFCASFVSDKYKVSSFDNDSNCRMTFARVYDDNNTIVKSYVPWNKQQHGGWIDVFPVDGVEDDFEEYTKRFSKISRLFRRVQFGRSALCKLSTYFDLKTNLKILIKKILFLNGLTLPRLINSVIMQSKSIEYGATQHWGLVAFDSYGTKDYHDIKLFDEVVNVDFEQHQVKALKGYDEYLRRLYGEYMQLPPEDKRVPKQTHYMHVFWKYN